MQLVLVDIRILRIPCALASYQEFNMFSGLLHTGDTISSLTQR